MNKTIIIASAITAGAAALVLLLKNKRAASNQLKPMHAPRSRHLTGTFAQEKRADTEDNSLAQGI